MSCVFHGGGDGTDENLPGMAFSFRFELLVQAGFDVSAVLLPALPTADPSTSVPRHARTGGMTKGESRAI
jgi:hypothetical protein